MTEQRVQRRLAAIMSADVVGYSRLMGADETGTLSALKELRRNLISPILTEYRGRLVKLMGDGALIEFASAVDAVDCAVCIQRRVAERNLAMPDSASISFRIGVNVGDIIIDGEDIYGDGVNVAARLEKLADPGGICISGMVFDQVKGKLDAGFQDFGTHQVRNIADPVRTYRVVAASVSSQPAGPIPLPAKPSIAVLPFDNMSDDHAQEYFSDGISEDLTTALSRFEWLFVIARNSAFTYKGKAVDVKKIRRELGVRYILEGSVRRAGDRVRINAQLIDAESDRHVWAQRYDRKMDDLFELQDDIVASIASVVGPEITLAEIERARGKRPDDLGAWDHYLRAIASLSQDDEAGCGCGDCRSQKSDRDRPRFRQCSRPAWSMPRAHRDARMDSSGAPGLRRGPALGGEGGSPGANKPAGQSVSGVRAGGDRRGRAGHQGGPTGDRAQFELCRRSKGSAMVPR